MSDSLAILAGVLGHLPQPGTKAADLTDDQKVALAYAAGVPLKVEMIGTQCVFVTERLVGFADSGDGTLIVGVAAP